MAKSTSVSELVRRLFTAFLSQDKQALEDLLSDDFTFNSPRDDHIDKREYFTRCFPHGGQFRTHQLEQLFAEGNEALVRYVAELRDGTRFRNTEYIRTDGSWVKEVDVYFGANLTVQPESKGDAAPEDGENRHELPPGLAQPALRALHGAGYTRLEQLTTVTEAELLKLHGLGPKALGVLRTALNARGLSFAAPT